MMVHPPIHIVPVNMCKHNAVTHALLNSIKDTHLILLQEPWFNKIGTARSDNAREGIDVLDGVANPAWKLLYPASDKDNPPKVMAYVRKQNQNTRNTTHFTVVSRIDMCQHLSVQVLDVIFDKEQWRVINFYHDTRNAASLDTLLGLDIDTIIPTFVIGNFNAHSQEWSPPDVPRSKGATCLEQWAATNLLTLVNTSPEKAPITKETQ